MATTIRLPEEIEQRLRQIAIRTRKTKSKIIKEALLIYFGNQSETKTPYELGKDLFGRFGSDSTDLSLNRKRILKEKLRAKNTR